MSATTLLVSKLNAPGLEQLVQRRAAAAHLGHHRVLLLALIRQALRVQERHQLAAAHDELVDGILRLVRDVLGEITTSTLMSSSILSASMPTRLTVKSFFSSLMMAQGWLPCWPICIIIGLDGMPNTGSGLMTPTTGFSGFIDPGNGAGEVVFEQPLAVGRQERNGLLLVQRT